MSDMQEDVAAYTPQGAPKASAPVQPADVQGVSGQRLKSYIERIERLEEEKAGIANDIKEIYSEAKGFGFDVKIMRTLIKLRKMDRQKRMEEEELLEVYKQAIGLTV